MFSLKKFFSNFFFSPTIYLGDFCTLDCRENSTCSEIEFQILSTNVNEIFECVVHQIVSSTGGTPTTTTKHDEDNQQPELEDDDDEKS